METNLVPTNQIYRRLLAEGDPGVRLRVYLDKLVRPWQAIMDMLVGGDQADPLAGARAWNWLLPDQTGLIQALLDQLEAAEAWRVARAALEDAARQFDRYAERLPLDRVEGWLVLADPEGANPFEHGFTGAVDWSAPRLIGQFWEPNQDNLTRLPGLIAHEMHHLVRLRLFPWSRQTSLADYLVLEGTAESFATGLFGDQVLGFYVSDLNADQLEAVRARIAPNLEATGFNTIRAYIFGDDLAQSSGYPPLGGMPRYGGYGLGYHVVQSFLKGSGLTIEEATFLPAKEIVERSGYF